MTEAQTPFVHQDGSTTPARGKPALDPNLLASAGRELRTISSNIPTGISLRVVGTAADMRDQSRVVGRAADALDLLREPSINTVVSTMTSLDPTMQALLADLVLTLANAGAGRQNLAIALRKLIEGRS